MGANNKILTADEVHQGALASTRDLYAVVLDDVDSLINQS